MKTFKGTMTIKWHKNDNGDMCGLTINTENKKTLNAKLKRIRVAFTTILDNFKTAYSVTFDMNERK